MKRSLYVGAAIVAAPRLLAFHVPPAPGGLCASASTSNRWRAVSSAGGGGRAGKAGLAALGKGLGCSLRARPGWCTRSFSSRLGASAGNGNASSPPPPSLQNIPHTSLVLRDEATGCDIYLVGCLHGSHASGRDVQDVLEKVRPGAVVLELCESRHKALRRDLEKRAKGDAPLEGKERWASAFSSWAKGVKKTSAKSGLVQGILSGLLSAPYVVQRLGDFDPGLEFKTAMVYADPSVRPGYSTGVARGMVSPAAGGGAGPGECSVVLGDRDVQETLRRLGGALTALTGRGEGGDEKHGVGRGDGAPEGASPGAGGGGVSVGTLDAAETEATSGWNWGTLASDARIVRVAVVGPSGRQWPDSLNVLDTVWRERQALGMLLLPLLLPMMVVSETLQRSIGGVATATVAASGSGGGALRGFGAFGGVGGVNSAGSAGVGGGVAAVDVDLGRLLEGTSDVLDTLLVVLSVWYMLRFFRLVIKERDDVLADNVMKACRDHPGRPVVAVLGLLHCNGVADIIRSSAGFRGVVRAGREE
ncbi:conserved unknown protein [Ectocarpus siliculosus]|uniref:TraB domain-containing protein n=1 Tax=Ectocarpus siliculosus TaxID=2880 RepID=D7FIC1_ECTSI|nr:conserved unknown protein [Ectocarpus siliculosus]|eukprot:CBJ28745.1 conserved unknown protein [Ectocarpus siliculosus]